MRMTDSRVSLVIFVVLLVQFGNGMQSVSVQQTMTAEGLSVGARVPPHWLSLCCAPACAISGYEKGDLTEGCTEGSALIALILNIIIPFLGSIYALAVWKPDPKNIKGDGTQRTVNNKCLAAFCAGGVQTVAFWESGDMCCTSEGCTWCYGDAQCALLWCLIPEIVSGMALDCCFATCCWVPNPLNFKRNTTNHGGGVQIVGAPVQAPGRNVALKEIMGPMASVVGQQVQ